MLVEWKARIVGKKINGNLIIGCLAVSEKTPRGRAARNEEIFNKLRCPILVFSFVIDVVQLSKTINTLKTWKNTF